MYKNRISESSFLVKNKNLIKLETQHHTKTKHIKQHQTK